MGDREEAGNAHAYTLLTRNLVHFSNPVLLFDHISIVAGF